jgi:hypothetical protein
MDARLSRTMFIAAQPAERVRIFAAAVIGH